jgi:hypothetical protein
MKKRAENAQDWTEVIAEKFKQVLTKQTILELATELTLPNWHEQAKLGKSTFVWCQPLWINFVTFIAMWRTAVSNAELLNGHQADRPFDALACRRTSVARTRNQVDSGTFDCRRSSQKLRISSQIFVVSSSIFDACLSNRITQDRIEIAVNENFNDDLISAQPKNQITAVACWYSRNFGLHKQKYGPKLCLVRFSQEAVEKFEQAASCNGHEHQVAHHLLTVASPAIGSSGWNSM